MVQTPGRGRGKRLRTAWRALASRTASARMRESEARYRAIFEAGPFPKVVYDPTTFAILAVNDAAVELYGYRRDELLTMTLKDLRPPEHVPKLMAALAQPLPDRYHAGVWTHRTKEGTLIEVDVYTHAMVLDGRAVRLAELQDVTEAKRAEAALTERTRQLDAVRAVSAEIAQELDLARLLRLLIGRAAELVGAASGTVYLWEPEQDGVVPMAWYGLGDWQATIRHPLGRGIAGTVAQTRQGLCVNDYRTSRYANPVSLQHTQVTASLGEPLLYREALIGAITLNHEDGRSFTTQDQDLLRLFATHAAIAIENARLFQAEQSRRRELEAVRSVTDELARELDLTALLRLIHTRVLELAQGDSGTVWLWDEAEQVLLPKCWPGFGEWMAEVRLRPGEGIAGTAATRRQGMLVNDFRTSPYRYPLFVERMEHVHVLAEPLLYRDCLVGVLSVNRNDPTRPFTAEDHRLVQLFAAQAAIAIENARLYDTTMRRSTEREALLQASQAMVSSLDLAQVLQTIVRHAAAISAAPIVRLFLLDDDTQLLRCRVGVGFPLAAEPELAIPVGVSLSGQVAATGEPLAVADTREDPRTYYPGHIDRYGVVSYLGLPVKYQTRLFGVLVFNTPAPRPYTADEISFLAAFAQQAAAAIQNARLFEAEQGRRRELEAVRTVTEEITRELDLSVLLTLLMRRAMELVRAASGAVFLWDEAAQVLTASAWLGFGDWFSGFQQRLGEGVVGQVAQRQRGIVVNDYRESPNALPIILERTPVTAILVEPLLYRGTLLGTLLVTHHGGGRIFSEGDHALLNLFAAQAAIAIENARLHEAAVRRGAELEALLTATHSVMSGLDLQEILDRIVAQAQHISGAPHVKVLLVDRDAHALEVRAVHGSAHRRGERLPLDRGASGTVAQTGQPIFRPDHQHEPGNLYADRDAALGIVGYLGLPITRGDEVLGVLTFNTTTPKAYSPAELAYLTSFADQAALAIEKARLFEELHDSYARLQAAQAELVRSEKLRGLGQMAAGIAHDLNNMLAAILGQVELLKLRGVTPDIQENLITLETAASDGAHVVRRLQDFARQRGSSPLVPMKLGPVVQEALDITGPRWKDEVQQRGRAIHVHVALGVLPPILGHAPEIREALTSLIFNAVDAMPQGGTLTFTGTAAPEGVLLRVTDTGVGMPEAVRQKVFEPFFTTKGVRGTGLGLSVVYGIMERHGGRVDVASVLGQGTTFTLRFQEAPAMASGVTPAHQPAVRASRCILLIDDDPMVRLTMTELLQAAGHTILVAESGPVGLAQLDHTLPDLVLTDLGMPEMSGAEVARRVKTAHPRLPVVLLTGWGETATLPAADRQAVDRVLGKPVRLADLLQVVAELTGTVDPAAP